MRDDLSNEIASMVRQLAAEKMRLRTAHERARQLGKVTLLA